MNLNKLRQQVRLVGELMGYTLTTDESFRVEGFMTSLTPQFEEVNFFGKIRGKRWDYFVFVCSV